MTVYQWLVVGAGPAGIAAVGKLLDHSIPPKEICWLDPHFQVGDLGRKWHNVPSNTKVALFLRYLNDCASFGYAKREVQFPLDRIDPEENCMLKEIAAPLQWVTHRLKKQVDAVQGEALALNLLQGRWEVRLESGTILGKNVILATGAEPKSLNYPTLKEIPLEIALNTEKLAMHVHPEDKVAVFGSSHSGILVLANLCHTPLKQIFHFYRSPHLYAIYLKDWILFDDSGLKGYAAKWARQNLDTVVPPQLKRVLLSEPRFEESLALCNKAIYAVGFDKRRLPILEQYPTARYNESTGIIAPGVFGLGIGFPQAALDRLGNRTFRVGLWKFMDYLNAMMPIWLQYAKG